MTPQAKKACSRVLIEEHRRSERRACRLMGANRSTIRYDLKKKDEKQLGEEIKEIAYEKRRFGYRKIRVLLLRRGKTANHKKVYRIYKALGLKVLKRGVRKRALGLRQPENVITKSNERWAFFMATEIQNASQQFKFPSEDTIRSLIGPDPITSPKHEMLS